MELARLNENFISPSASVHPSVRIGTGNSIGPFCYIGPNVTIGDNNIFVSHVCIGTPAEFRGKCGANGVRIGDGNVFSEFTSVHLPVDSKTVVGSNVYLMTTSHIAHDCTVEDDVTICNGTQMAGHVTIMRGANIGLGCMIHQYQVIGSYSMLGMGSVVTRGSRIVPGRKYAGNPVRLLGRNSIGIERASVTPEQLHSETDRWKSLKK